MLLRSMGNLSQPPPPAEDPFGRDEDHDREIRPRFSMEGCPTSLILSPICCGSSCAQPTQLVGSLLELRCVALGGEFSLTEFCVTRRGDALGIGALREERCRER